MAQQQRATIAPGFADPPRQSQTVFRAVMNALAQPTTVQPLAVGLSAPEPLTPELAAIALAMTDNETTVWLDAPLAASPGVSAFLRFHTGAPIVSDPAQAAWAFVSEPSRLPAFTEIFALGTPEYPDRSTTIVLAVSGFSGPEALLVEGPGILGNGSLAPDPLPRNFAAEWRKKRALFPLGVDFLFASRGEAAGLPRSSRLIGGRDPCM